MSTKETSRNKIYLHPVKSKPRKVIGFFAGDPLAKKHKHKIGQHIPKAEGQPEKLDLDIAEYDKLILAGVMPTAAAHKLRSTIEPPPPALPGTETAEGEAAAE